MQIIIIQQILDMLGQSCEMASEFFGVLLRALWSNIVSFIPTLWDAILSLDWPTAFTYIVMFAGSVVLFYHLVRHNFSTISSQL